MDAMTTVRAYDLLVAWTRENVAPKLRFLCVPEADDDETLDAYEPSYRQPTVFEHFVPSAQRLADGEAQYPSIGVQLLQSSDLPGGDRSDDYRMVLAVWDAGNVLAKGEGLTRDNQGWRSLYNGLDQMRQALLDAETVAGRRLDRKKGVSVAMLDYDKVVEDQYPYWLGRCDFTLVSGQPHGGRFADWL